MSYFFLLSYMSHIFYRKSVFFIGICDFSLTGGRDKQEGHYGVSQFIV